MPTAALLFSLVVFAQTPATPTAEQPPVARASVDPNLSGVTLDPPFLRLVSPTLRREAQDHPEALALLPGAEWDGILTVTSLGALVLWSIPVGVLALSWGSSMALMGLAAWGLWSVSRSGELHPGAVPWQWLVALGLACVTGTLLAGSLLLAPPYAGMLAGTLLLARWGSNATSQAVVLMNRDRAKDSATSSARKTSGGQR